MTREETEAARILRARAARLAQMPAGDELGAILDVLEFNLAGERYAIETRHVDEVQPLRNFTPLPGVPACVPGIVSVRGRILPVVDLKDFFDLPGLGTSDLHHVIVVRGLDLEVGLLAEDIAGLRHIRADGLQSLPTLAGARGEYLKGVTEERVAVLDLHRLLEDPRMAGAAAGN